MGAARFLPRSPVPRRVRVTGPSRSYHRGGPSALDVILVAVIGYRHEFGFNVTQHPLGIIIAGAAT